MSGSPGGGLPACLEENLGGGFFVPQGAAIYHVGDTIPFSWYGGAIIPTADTRDITIELALDWKIGVKYFSETIVNGTNITYEQEPGAHGESWDVIPVCNITQFSYNWTIPTSFNTTTDGRYTAYARNVTGDDLWNMAMSQPFVIQPAVRSPSMTPTSTMSTAPTSPMSTLPTGSIPAPTQSGGLGLASKIGIGVGVPIGGVLIGLVGWWAGRHRKGGHRNVAVAPAERWEKPELHACSKPRAELGSANIAEMDARGRGCGPDHLNLDQQQKPQEMGDTDMVIQRYSEVEGNPSANARSSAGGL
ncbi:hypothetical protein SAMD00023353_8100060 [Rosellinia necatrix]|uniref:Uncharacterized protein n=1 Tax=Rosellinia necatrix TaxID=77044 RepID=A0A1W2TV44_ROSNE|nr:hypothetical protein SAMD00023353_8100060 [Rosellinia necatrix]